MPKRKGNDNKAKEGIIREVWKCENRDARQRTGTGAQTGRVSLLPASQQMLSPTDLCFDSAAASRALSSGPGRCREKGMDSESQTLGT